MPITFSLFSSFLSSHDSTFSTSPIFKQRFHNLGIRAAVKRSGECRDSGCYCAINVGKSSGNNARCKCRSVKFVIGVEDQTNVHHSRFVRFRLFRRAAYTGNFLQCSMIYQAATTSFPLRILSQAATSVGIFAVKRMAACIAFSRSVPCPSTS